MFEKLNGNANAEMNIELLSELAYLEQCIMETIRLYPGVIAPGRMLESPLVLGNILIKWLYYLVIYQNYNVQKLDFVFCRRSINYSC